VQQDRNQHQSSNRHASGDGPGLTGMTGGKDQDEGQQKQEGNVNAELNAKKPSAEN
jgi:hypothetical protein